MNAPARRVRTLRLAAADEGAARRGAFLIDDALRTASLPGGDGGRLLLVRRLALGYILPGQSPATVALAIEQAVWRLGVTPVHGGDAAAASAPAVYFRDRAEAVTVLALKLAQGRDVGAWFWPLIAPGWEPGMAATAGLRAVMATALAVGPGAATLVAMVDALHREGSLTPLLETLRPDDGPALLAACGWAGSDAAPLMAGAHFFPHWQPTLARWLAAWGVYDARTLWLAAISLAGGQLGPLVDQLLPRQAMSALHALALTILGGSVPAPVAAPSPGKSPAELVSPLAPPAVAALAPMPAQAEDVSPPVAQPRGATSATASRAQEKAPSARQAQVARSAAADGAVPLARPVGWPFPDEALPTHWAGLYLLLPVLARLGLADMLAAQPALATVGLPARILLAVARSLRIPAGDAALTPLAHARSHAAALTFAVPAAWSTGLLDPGPWQVRRIAGRRDTRLLCDSSGRLPLALWHGAAPDDVRALVGRQTTPLARGPLVPPHSDLALLVGAWGTALRRWLTRYADLRLREVTARPGRIAATRTHLDIYFDLRQADTRIRRSGLDIDPGWLPWFGRVVAYHYV